MAMTYLEDALREMRDEKANASWIESITDYMDKHTAMVTTLRECVAEWREDGSAHAALRAIDALLSTEPAEPTTLSDFVNLHDAERKVIGQQVAHEVDARMAAEPVKVDVEAVWKVIAHLRQQGLAIVEADKLAAAIGDKK